MDDVMGGPGDEAYTIGIRLALEDGVSVGMAVLADEIAGFGRALAAMPGLGSAAAALAVAQVGAVRTQLAPVSDAAAVPGAVTPGPPVEAPVRPVAAVAEPVVERAVVERAVAPVAAEAARAPAWAPVARGEAPGAMAPVALAGDEQVHPASAARGAGEPATRMLAPVVLPLERSAGSAGGQTGWSASGAGEAAASGASGVGFPASPSEQFGAGPPNGAGWAPGVAAQLPQVAPVASSQDESSGGGGPVYLDGRLLGHWLSEHLAREAGRPMGGGVGFDGRMGPAWPGALQGG
jgi:hypothetical protein